MSREKEGQGQGVDYTAICTDDKTHFCDKGFQSRMWNQASQSSFYRTKTISERNKNGVFELITYKKKKKLSIVPSAVQQKVLVTVSFCSIAHDDKLESKNTFDCLFPYLEAEGWMAQVDSFFKMF